MRLKDPKPGPLRHKELPSDLIGRIQTVGTILSEVLTMSEQEWIEGLKRDSDPLNEVLWWERLAECYEDFTADHRLSDVERQATFNVIFGLLSGLDGEQLKATLEQFPESLI